MPARSADDLRPTVDPVHADTLALAPRWRGLAQFEATVGALFAFILAFAVLVIGGTVVYASYGRPGHGWLVAAWITLCVAEGIFVLGLKRSLEANLHPFAPSFALRQCRWPLVMRPVASLWWLAHFALAMGAGLALDHVVAYAPAAGALPVLAIAAGVYTVTFCANLYLLLAVTAGGGGTRAVHVLWRWRMLIDLIPVGLVLLARTFM